MDYNDVIKQIEATDSKFGSVVDDAQKRMLREVLTLTKDLELSNGRIMPTIGNLKLISKIKEKLNKAVVNKDYLNGVKDLLKSFESIQSTQLGYFKTISDGKTTQQKYDLVRGMAIENTAAQLTESGIDANVTSKLKDMLLRSVTSGGLYRDLVGEVSEFLSNTDKSPGALSRYAKTYTTTALNQFAGQTNKLMTEDSGAEWFRYVGSDIETTREFCELMTDKDYFHKSEIPELLKGHIDGKKCEIYDKTKLPKGMIEGTNKDNFQVNCGGWNCRHAVVPVLTFTVPKNLRDRFASEIKFEPAKTIDEAIQFAKNNGVEYTGAYKKLEVEQLNAINQSLYENKKITNPEIWKTTNFDRVHVVNDSNDGFGKHLSAGDSRGLLVNSDSFNKINAKKIANNEYEIESLQKKITRKQNKIDDYPDEKNKIQKEINDYKNQIEELKSNKFSNVSNTLKSQIDHEIGHTVQTQMSISDKTAKYNLSYSDYNKIGSDMKVNAKKLGTYATTKEEEYFAESWAAFTNGRKDLVSDYMKSIFKKVLI